jgi:hypothetical protein
MGLWALQFAQSGSVIHIKRSCWLSSLLNIDALKFLDALEAKQPRREFLMGCGKSLRYNARL